MLHVIRCETALDFENLPLARLESSLAGPPRAEILYAVALEPENLWFGGEVRAQPRFDVSAEGFTEGLWNFDCLELFVHCPASGRYAEFNLAPNGAWWSCLFSSPRVRIPAERILVETTFSAEEWKAWAKISRAALVAAIGEEPWTANFTAIVGPQDDGAFHSVASLSEVDFHRPSEFLPF